MEYKGVNFTLTRGEPGFWKWRMRIDGRTKTGSIRANLKLLAVRRVQMKIDAELRKARARAGHHSSER